MEQRVAQFAGHTSHVVYDRDTKTFVSRCIAIGFSASIAGVRLSPEPVLFVPKRLNRIKAGSTARREEAKRNPNQA